VQDGPQSQLRLAGVEERVYVPAQHVADERIGQEPFEPWADLDPHRAGGRVVEDQQAAGPVLAADPELPHRGHGELLRRGAPAVRDDHDPDVDPGLGLHRREPLVVPELLLPADHAGPIVDVPFPRPEGWPVHHQDREIDAEHQQQDDATKLLHGVRAPCAESCSDGRIRNDPWKMRVGVGDAFE
jgi:hypothetical protein